MSRSPRIVAVTPGPPWGPETFSGTSVALLDALERRGALAGAVDGRTGLLARVEQAASVGTDLERWKQRYNAGASPLSPAIRGAMSAVASRRLAGQPPADAVLQMTGYFAPRPPRPTMLRTSYHDGNLAGFLRRADLRIDPAARMVRRALAYERSLYDSIDVIFCMSEQLRRSFVDDFAQAPDKVVTVGAGANVTVPEAVPERPDGPLRLLFVGKQFERKGGPTVLEAFERLRGRHPDAELAIVGPTGLDVDRPGVTVHGRIARDEPGGEQRMAALFSSASAFVMPSVYEPLGVALIEAMGYGLPCVASTSGAIPEIVAEGETGFLVPPGEAVALAEQLDRLAADPALRRRMGAAAARRYRDSFTWDAVAGRMLDAIAARRAG